MKPDCFYIRRHKANVFNFDQEAVLWLRSLPEAAKKLALRFPPSCLVKAKEFSFLRCPAPGEIGQVVSYYDPDEEHLEGMVTVYDPDMNDDCRHQCRPEWLEVVGYWGDMDEDLVKRVLEGNGND